MTGRTSRTDGLVADLLADPNVRAKANLGNEIATLASQSVDDDQFCVHLSRLLFQQAQMDVLHAHGLPYPIYNYLQDFAANEAQPWAPTLKQRPVVPGRIWSLFGRDIGIPIGIPASVLTMNSEWIRSHAQNGFNVLTYKTVRSAERPTLPAPNWVFLENNPSPFEPGGSLPSVNARGGLETWPSSPDRFSTANSFGVPSKAPAVWQDDVRRSRELLAPDQLLILSVMGTFEDKCGDELVQDFVDVSVLGAETEIDVIELNLSCPNGVVDGTPLPPIYHDAAVVRRIVEAVRSALNPTVSLVVKFGYLEAPKLRSTLLPIAGIIDGVSGINTVQIPVKDPTGKSDAFPGRREAGVSGYVLRDLALDFVTVAADCRQQSGASFDIIGMGGVMNADDARRLYDAGASAVQSASGAFYNPHLAHQLVREHGSDFPTLTVADRMRGDKAREAILSSLSEQRGLTLGDLIAVVSDPPDMVRREVDQLVSEDVLSVKRDRGSIPRYARR